MDAENQIACTICDKKFWPSSQGDLEAQKKSWRASLSGWNYFIIGGKPYCGHCLMCRGCREILPAHETYKPCRGDDSIRGPLCGKCLVLKSEARRGWGGLKRISKEPDGKPLKSLVKLSTSYFKLHQFIELLHGPTGRIVQVGVFHDYNRGGSGVDLRLSQFCSGVKSYDRKGREKPLVFERRGVLVLPTYDTKKHHGLLTYTNGDAIIRRATKIFRDIGYHATAQKDCNGRRRDIPHEWRRSRAEWELDHRREMLDLELRDLVRQDLETVQKKYNERGERISWVEKDIPGRDA